RTFNYNFSGDTSKTTKTLPYADSDEIDSSTNYKNEVLNAPATTDVKKSVTLFSGNEGEEKAQRTFNYNFAGDTIKTTTILHYATTDEMKSSTTYKNEVLNAPAMTDMKKSVTLFS